MELSTVKEDIRIRSQILNQTKLRNDELNTALCIVSLLRQIFKYDTTSPTLSPDFCETKLFKTIIVKTYFIVQVKVI